MSFGPHICHRTLQRYHPKHDPFVWISNDFLGDLLHQFTVSKTSKRHGSSVPGPLEAIRRMAKRRMMNMAVAGAAPTDAGMFMLPGAHSIEKGLRWEAPVQLGQTSSIIPTERGKCHYSQSVESGS